MSSKRYRRNKSFPPAPRSGPIIREGNKESSIFLLFFLLLFFLFSILGFSGIQVVGGEGESGELVISLSTTNITHDKLIYVNVSLEAGNNTGNVSIIVKDPNDIPALFQSSELADGNASFEFSLFKWHPNGTYSVDATAITSDNQTYEATSHSFTFTNWTPSPVVPTPPSRDDNEWFIPPAPLLIVTGLTTASLIMGYSTEKGKYKFWLLLIPLYTRLKKSEALEDFNRGRIYRTIEEHPGIRYSELRTKLGIGNGVLTYHLKVLQKMKYVKAIGDNTLKRFYPWGVATVIPPDLAKPFTPIQRSIVDYLHNNTWSTQKNMVTALQMKQQTLSKNLKKLEQSNIVRRVKEINVFRYNLTDGYISWFNNQVRPKCPKCLNVCRIGAKFCENCGTRLDMK